MGIHAPYGPAYLRCPPPVLDDGSPLPMISDKWHVLLEGDATWSQLAGVGSGGDRGLQKRSDAIPHQIVVLA